MHTLQHQDFSLNFALVDRRRGGNAHTHNKALEKAKEKKIFLNLRVFFIVVPPPLPFLLCLARGEMNCSSGNLSRKTKRLHSENIIPLFIFFFFRFSHFPKCKMTLIRSICSIKDFNKVNLVFSLN